jgi:hypothetical protein
MTQLTLQTNVRELVEEHPQLKRVFLARGYSLDLTCLDQADNTVEDAAAICGFDPDEMLDELHRTLESLQEGEK